MMIDIHLPFRPCVVYGESSLLLPVSCGMEIVGSICLRHGFDAIDPSRRSRSRSPKVLRAPVLHELQRFPQLKRLQLQHLREQVNDHNSLNSIYAMLKLMQQFGEQTLQTPTQAVQCPWWTFKHRSRPSSTFFKKVEQSVPMPTVLCWWCNWAVLMGNIQQHRKQCNKELSGNAGAGFWNAVCWCTGISRVAAMSCNTLPYVCYAAWQDATWYWQGWRCHLSFIPWL